MFVLGIDPGVSRCGYGCVASSARGGRPVAVGVLTTPPSDPLPSRLATLDRDLRALVADMRGLAAGAGRPLVVAVERLFFQSNLRTAMSVGQASGLVLAAAAGAGCEVVQYTPNEVKQAVAGTGAAPKEQVARMVQSLLGLARRPSPPDAADALALALCHLARAPLQARLRAVPLTAPGGGEAP
jgi:crossover junction endodeoxyribonuclease RuvC